MYQKHIVSTVLKWFKHLGRGGAMAHVDNGATVKGGGSLMLQYIHVVHLKKAS